jgi:hypothetical protein
MSNDTSGHSSLIRVDDRRQPTLQTFTAQQKPPLIEIGGYGLGCVYGIAGAASLEYRDLTPVDRSTSFYNVRSHFLS